MELIEGYTRRGQRKGRRSIEEEGKGNWGSLEVVMKKNTRRGTYEDGGL